MNPPPLFPIFVETLAFIAVSAVAHNGASGIVLERMTAMSAMRDAMSELTPMMQGSAPYDPAAVSALATKIAENGGAAMLALFPAGSTEGVTYARPEIRSDWQNSEALAAELKARADALAEAAPRGLQPSMPMEMAMDGSMEMDMGSAAPAEPNFSVAELMGYGAPAETKSAGQAADESGNMDLAMQPVPELFQRVSLACASCHASYRAGRN